MDAQNIMHPLHVPDLPPARLHAWCAQRTRLDLDRARLKGKTISEPSARRMLARRYVHAGLQPLGER